MLDLLKFCSSHHFKNPKYSTGNSSTDFVSPLTNKYKELWKKEIKNSTRSDFCRKFKHDYKVEDYTAITPVINTKRDYTKFRTSNRKLAVET